jgi:Zn-dependent protease with chaperone function
MRLKLIMILLLCLPFGAAVAQGTTPTEAAAIAAAQADHGLYTLPPALLTKAVALQHIGVTLQFVGILWSFAVLVLLLELGIAARMRNVAVNLTRKLRGAGAHWVQCAIFVLQLVVVLALAELPLRIYGHSVGLAYGLSVQGWGSWLGDSLKSLVIELAFGIPLVSLLFWRIRRSPRWWWLQLAGCLMAFSVAAVFITPYVIDPLFNHFEPLKKTNPELVAQLEQVVARGHGIAIPPERMYLMKASEKVTGLNAYVTGFGASKRVVVWDTTIAKATPEEIQTIFGHEMGHYVLGHVTEGMWLGCAGILVLCFLGFHLFRWLLARFGGRWKIPAQEHWGALVVVVLVAQLLSFLAEPVANAFSRHLEHNADVYGLEVVHGIVADPSKVGAATFQLLGETSLVDPDPSPLDFWFATHPSIPFRVAFAKQYDPWVPGAEPKYFKK